MIHSPLTSDSGNWIRQFLVRVLETRAVVFDAFKAKVQKLIEDLFLPPSEDDVIALAVLQEAALPDEEYGNNGNNNNNNNNMDVDQGDKQQQQRRRKSFSNGLCEKTLKTRYAELDEKILSGIISCYICRLVFTV
jgi:hypothetical protein